MAEGPAAGLAMLDGTSKGSRNCASTICCLLREGTFGDDDQAMERGGVGLSAERLALTSNDGGAVNSVEAVGRDMEAKGPGGPEKRPKEQFRLACSERTLSLPRRSSAETERNMSG